MNSQSFVTVFSGSLNAHTELLCDARELHRVLQVGRDFSNWIKGRIAEYGFEENRDFVLVFRNGETKKGRGGDRRSIDYHLTLDTAKELAMVEKTEVGRQIRRYFIECEKKVHGSFSARLKLTPEQKQQIRQAVQLRHHRTGEHWQAIYEKLHSFCKVNSYHEIAADQFQAALNFLASMENAPDLFGQHKTVLDDRAMQHIKALVNYLPYMIEFYHIVEPAVRCLNRGLTYHAHDRFTHAHIAIRGLARSLNMPIMEYHEAHAILTS